ncbi:unnamed protein product [Hyaloperonospora brassicae]|uniref:Uncharacterized protein n=1 Tax=Hyaloperonospora brassicae TaxID=162125 RepID=A0AAV0U2K6_HYABA|nr:unnamed protein product [Hyaloperonospora brassicae]
MKAVSIVAAATAAALFGASQAADIDNGFVHDGATTYCMGVNGPLGALTFDTLEVSSAGRCPVGVTLTFPSADFYVHEPITVKWAAKAHADLGNSLFPNAIDAVTKVPPAVTSSALFACTAGTNCATHVGGTPTGAADGTSAGPFAPDGAKALATNTFTLATASDYIIVGLVALPGDSSLGVAATEYVVFKKISVVPASTTSNTSGSVAPLASGSDDAALAARSLGPPEPVASTTPSPALTSAPSSALGSSNATTTTTTRDAALKQGLQVDVDGDKEPKTATELAGAGRSIEDAATSRTDPTGEGKSPPELTETVSTSRGNGGVGKGGVTIIAVVVACCLAALALLVFMIRRRKRQRANANKAFDLDSPCVVSESNNSVSDGKASSKIDLTYVANVSARNTDSNANDNMMTDDMAIVHSGLTSSSNTDGSVQSLPKNSFGTDNYSENIAYGGAGSAGHPNEAEIDAYRLSNTSGMASYVSNARSDASMSHFGDSLVTASQKKYFQTGGDWNDSRSSQMDSHLHSMEQAESKAYGVGSYGGSSMASESSMMDIASRATDSREHDSMVGAHFNDESRSTTGHRETEDSRVSEDSRATGFLEAMGESRLQSEVSVDSYGFRASCSSTDSYSSGMSSYSRGSSRISGCSVDSNLDSSNSFSKY